MVRPPHASHDPTALDAVSQQRSLWHREALNGLWCVLAQFAAPLHTARHDFRCKFSQALKQGCQVVAVFYPSPMVIELVVEPHQAEPTNFLDILPNGTTINTHALSKSADSSWRVARSQVLSMIWSTNMAWAADSPTCR